MPIHSRALFVYFASALAAGAAFAAVPVQPLNLLHQSESEQRQQIQQQEQKLRQLEAERDAALERVRELEAQLEALKKAAGSSAPGNGAEPGPGRVPLPTTPDASPADGTPPPTATPGGSATPAKAPANPWENSATVFDTIRARFAADFAGKPAPREGVSDDRLARLWTTEVERWANVANRDMRRPVIWNTRVLVAESSGRSWRLDVVCVDPVTQADVGQAFSIQLQGPQSGSYDQSLRLGKSDGDFTLRAVYIPQIVINPSRFEPGPFDHPPFVGPFLEYGFRLALTSFTRVENRPPPRHAAPSGAGAPPAAPPPASP